MKRMCCFNLLGGLVLSLMTFIVWWHWEWVVSSSEESGSTILRNLGIVYGGLIAIWVAVWRSVERKQGTLLNYWNYLTGPF